MVPLRSWSGCVVGKGISVLLWVFLCVCSLFAEWGSGGLGYCRCVGVGCWGWCYDSGGLSLCWWSVWFWLFYGVAGCNIFVVDLCSVKWRVLLFRCCGLCV